MESTLREGYTQSRIWTYLGTQEMEDSRKKVLQMLGKWSLSMYNTYIKNFKHVDRI